MIRLSDVLGLPVRSESGQRLGRVHDLRVELTPRSMRVTGLVVGWLGAFERIGLDAPRSLRRVSTHTVVPWSAVVRASRRGIVVREGTAPR